MRHWTYEDRVFLEQNYKNYSVKALARELGRTEESIRQQARCMGIRKFATASDTEQRKEFVKAHAGKMKASAMADILGCNVGSVYRIGYKLDISLKVRPDQSIIDEMRRLKDEGLSLTKIADKMPEYSEGTIWRYLNVY